MNVGFDVSNVSRPQTSTFLRLELQMYGIDAELSSQFGHILTKFIFSFFYFWVISA